MQELTSRQKDVLHFIGEFIENNGFPPTLQEIADKMKIQPSAARAHLLLMEKKKTLRYVPNTSRGIELLHRKPAGVPIYGSVPAGNPFFAEDNIVDSFEVRKYLSTSEDLFSLSVRGDSMMDLLYPGDLVFVDPKKQPRNGEIVVASVEGQPTLKWHYRFHDEIELRPQNKKYSVISVKPHDETFHINGVVVGYIRALDRIKIDQSHSTPTRKG
jgi:repressor LexA